MCTIDIFGGKLSMPRVAKIRRCSVYTMTEGTRAMEQKQTLMSHEAVEVERNIHNVRHEFF
jgi:hypothetical protein